MFPYSYRNTSGSLGERKIEVGTRAGRASVSTLFQALPNFHSCFNNLWEHGENVFYFFNKITRRKLKRGSLTERKFSILYRNVNSPTLFKMVKNGKFKLLMVNLMVNLHGRFKLIIYFSH